MTTLVISDVHANAAALDGVLDAEDHVDDVVFLGDAVDVGPQPDAAVSTLRSVADHRVIGNHDRLVLDADPDVETDDEYERWQQWTQTTITDANETHLGDAPRTAVVTIEGTAVRLHHGDFEPPGDVDEWTTRTTPTDSPELFETAARRYDEDTVLLGHSHRPYVTEIDGITFVNPGSVGLQRHDMRSDVARYAVLEDGEFELRSVEYDTEAVVAACDELPLPAAFRTSWQDRYRPSPDGE